MPVKIVIAPDGFKGCLAAREVCEALARGLHEADPELEVIKVPIADGGDGTTEALVSATDGCLVEARVSGPLGAPVSATLGILGDARTAVIEMAQASGLALLPPARRNPLLTSSYGTGQLIQEGLDRGCRQFIVGLGGSATNEGGAGLAQALGVRFLDEEDREIHRATGQALGQIARIDVSGLDPRVGESRFRVACDVKNPLHGPQGATYVYGPQKGATSEMVEELDAGLRHFAELIRTSLGKEVADIPGAGAAGGLGAGLMAFCEATLEPGADIVLEVVGLRELAQDADLLITGEGRLDDQTAFGKGPWAVAQLGRELNIPVVAIAGAVICSPGELTDWGLLAAWSCCPGPESLEEAMQPEVARRQLHRAGYNLARLLQLGQQLRP